MDIIDIEDNLKALKNRYFLVSSFLESEEILEDKKTLSMFHNEFQLISPVVEQYLAYEKQLKFLDELREFVKSLKGEELEFFNKELSSLLRGIDKQEKTILKLYNAYKSNFEKVIIELTLLDGDNKISVLYELSNVFKSIANRYCFNFEMSDECLQDVKFLYIEGSNVKDVLSSYVANYKILKNEKTCNCRVLIYNNYQNAVNIKDEDIEIHTFRSSGAGGQHINTTDSAVRAIYKPTGAFVVCREERSQIANRKIAIIKLKEKVVEEIQLSNILREDKERKSQLKVLNRSGNFIEIDYNRMKVKIANKQIIDYSDFIQGKLNINDK